LATGCGETLWAFNREHIVKLREYVGATLRERTLSSRGGMIANFPQWLRAAKNRDAVLACLTRLEDKLGTIEVSGS